MELEWPPLHFNSLNQDSCYSTDTQQYQLDSLPSQEKPPLPRANPIKQPLPTQQQQQIKTNRAKDRSVSQRRRHYSTSSTSSRHRRRDKHIVVKQQPGGWYQVDRIGRNLSLAPRSSSKSRGLEYYYSGDQAQKKRRNRRNRKKPVRLHNQSRFPSPSVFDSTLGILQELPCARLHYDSFRRLFPTLPTRTEKERKFRLEAAKELPFAKYPDDQLYGILNISESKSSSVKKTNETKENKLNQIGQQNQRTISEGDTQVTDDAHEDSENDDVDDLHEEEESSDEDEDVRKPDEIVPDYKRSTVAKINKDNSCPVPQRPPTVQSEDFLSLSDTENKICTDSQRPNQEVNREIVTHSPNDEDRTRLEESTQATENNVPDKKFDNVNLPSSWATDSDINQKDKRSNDLNFVKVIVPNDTSSYQTTSEAVGMNSLVPERGGTHSTADERIPSIITKVPRVRHPLRGVPCTGCGNIAYPAERLEADGQVFHVTCFRCQQCGTLLQRGGWNQRGTQHYCNPCHRRIALQTLRH